MKNFIKITCLSLLFFCLLGLLNIGVNLNSCYFTNSISKINIFDISTIDFDNDENRIISLTKNNTLAAINDDSSMYGNIPKTIVNVAHNISGNSGRKIVLLSNGWVVAVTKYSNSGYLHISKDSGITWSQLCKVTSSFYGAYSITSYGTKVYVMANTSSAVEKIWVVDALTQENINIGPTGIVIDSAQLEFGEGCSITADDNGILHAAWSSRNSWNTYSFNLRYSKSQDFGQSWSVPVQLTNINITSGSVVNPSIITKNNKPVIICEGNGVTASAQFISTDSDAQSIIATSFDNSTSKWNFYNIYSAEGYAQDYPSTCMTSDGSIHVAWHGRDSRDTNADNIKYSTSSDGGVTWSELIKVTNGDSYLQQYPSITCDSDNNIYIYYQGRQTTNYFNISKVSCINGSWSTPLMVTNNTTNHAYYPQTVYDENLNLSNGDPLVMWQDNQIYSIFFKGKLSKWYNNEVQGTVISGAYKISGYSGKKMVELKDGTIVNIIQDTANHKLMLYQSKDNGAKWTLIKEDILSTSIQDVVLTELDDGNFGYLLIYDNKYASFKKINKNNYEFMNQTVIGSTQMSMGSCSIALGNDGVLHAVWSGCSYSNNIWYSKSIDDGMTWESPIPLMSIGNNAFNPFIVINNNNIPIVFFCYLQSEYVDDGEGGEILNYSYYLRYINNVNGIWTSMKTISSKNSYIQLPTAIVDLNGTIHCVWNVGNSPVYTNSTDGGNTWSTQTTISGGKYLTNPSLSCNKYNELFVLGSSNANSSNMNINMLKRNANGVWSNISLLTNNTTANADFPQAIYKPTQDFKIPEFIYQDTQTNSIRFQSMLNNPKLFAEIINPTLGEVFSLSKAAVEIKIQVSDENNNALTCKYYLDNENEPRETKLVSDTYMAKEVAFTPIDISLLPQGQHGIRVQVSNGNQTYETTGGFYIDKEQPSIGSNIVSTDTSITMYASASDMVKLNPNPYRYSLGILTGEWTSEVSNTWDNLKPNTLYSVTFEARDALGNISIYKKDIYTKAQLHEISINNITSTSLDLNVYDDNPETTLYQISVGVKYVDENGKLTDTPAWFVLLGKKLSILNLTPNSKYTFTVKIKNSENEESQYTLIEEIETLSSTLSVPVNILISETATSATVSWNAVEGALEYEIEADGLIKCVKATTFKHTGLVPNTQHSYRVRAKNYFGYSDFSPIETVITGSDMSIGILSINVFPTNTTVTLTWNEVEDAQNYEVEFDGKIIDNGVNTFCTKSGLLPGSQHIYKVRAINAAGEGTWSESAGVTTYPLKTPAIIEIIEDETEVKLTWNTVDKAVEYDIEVNGNTVLTIADHVYIHTGLTTETKYLYRIRAKNNTGESAWSNVLSATTLPARPIIPENITAHSIQNIIVITWDKVDGAIGYDVELDGVIIDNGNSTTYMHEDLSSFSLHKYRIRAKNEAVEGKWSELLDIKTMEGKPSYPEKIKVDSTTTITTLSWESENGALSYDVEVDGQIIENITKTTYVHRRITPGTEHLYRIRTKNITGTSAWSGYVINNALRAECKKDKAVDLGLTASDIIDFSKYSLKVTYNPDVIEVMDLCTLSSKVELNEGKIQGTGITIISFKPGEIVFVVDKAIPPGESWSGVINSIKFRAKVSGGTNITYTVYGTPNDMQ